MLAPVRGVFAIPCDMGEMEVSSGSSMTHESHDMSAMLSADAMQMDMGKFNCCDDLSIDCSGGCDLGISVSLVLPEISYAPVYKNSFSLISSSYKTLFRELTPPSRPPANLHS